MEIKIKAFLSFSLHDNKDLTRFYGWPRQCLRQLQNQEPHSAKTICAPSSKITTKPSIITENLPFKLALLNAVGKERGFNDAEKGDNKSSFGGKRWGTRKCSKVDYSRHSSSSRHVIGGKIYHKESWESRILSVRTPTGR